MAAAPNGDGPRAVARSSRSTGKWRMASESAQTERRSRLRGSSTAGTDLNLPGPADLQALEFTADTHRRLRRSGQVKAALSYAERMHEGQRRAVDGAPFIAHPIEVAILLHETGAADHVVAAGVLHDTLEKTDAAPDDIHARFGRRVGDIVCAVSDDRELRGYARRKAALRDKVARSGQDALTVFAADKLAKVRELRFGDRSGLGVRSRKLRHYQLSLAMLQRRLPASPLVGALAAELDGLSDASECPPPAERAHS
jgi:HD domain